MNLHDDWQDVRAAEPSKAAPTKGKPAIQEDWATLEGLPETAYLVREGYTHESMAVWKVRVLRRCQPPRGTRHEGEYVAYRALELVWGGPAEINRTSEDYHEHHPSYSVALKRLDETLNAARERLRGIHAKYLEKAYADLSHYESEAAHWQQHAKEQKAKLLTLKTFTVDDCL